MNLDITPTRSAALDLKDERRAMQEGYTFLDEKCLVLAAEMLGRARRYTLAAAPSATPALPRRRRWRRPCRATVSTASRCCRPAPTIPARWPSRAGR